MRKQFRKGNLMFHSLKIKYEIYKRYDKNLN